jgi:hypothetical protein
MKLNMKAVAFASAILWGGVLFVTGIANLIWPDYGSLFLQVMASVYPGYKALPSIGSVAVGALYGVLDGAIFGVVFVWLHNRLLG